MRKLPPGVRAERKRAANRAWREANKEAIKAKKNAWRLSNLETVSERNRLAKYGITAEECRAMLAAQIGCCAVCAMPISLLGEKSAPDLAHVDHDHETGAVRGLLCRACNLAIGHMKDSPQRLRAAAAYLERAR